MLYCEESILNKYAIGDSNRLCFFSSLKNSYRTSKHFFTVLPTTFFGSKTSLHHYIQQKPIKQIWLAVKNTVLTTVLPTIKLPFFQTWNYRTSIHGVTELSTTYLGEITGFSPTFLIPNLFKQLTNKYRKDVLNYDFKNNISLDDDFFRIKRRGGISS